MSFAYAVVGAGRQGVAAAFDLAVRGNPSRILFVDREAAAARRAAERVNALTGLQSLRVRTATHRMRRP